MKLKSFGIPMIILIVLTSCETQTAFRSEKKLNKQIQAHTWKKVRFSPLNINDRHEDWIFKDGTVVRHIYNLDNNSISASDTGSYSIDAKLSHSYLTIRDFKFLDEKLNARWNIVELTDDVLSIAYKEGNSGLYQREFVPK